MLFITGNDGVLCLSKRNFTQFCINAFCITHFLWHQFWFDVALRLYTTHRLAYLCADNFIFELSKLMSLAVFIAALLPLLLLCWRASRCIIGWHFLNAIARTSAVKLSRQRIAVKCSGRLTWTLSHINHLYRLFRSACSLFHFIKVWYHSI